MLDTPLSESAYIGAAAGAAAEAFDALRAPIRMVCPPHVPVPFAPNLKDLYVPTAARVESAVRAVMEHSARQGARA